MQLLILALCLLLVLEGLLPLLFPNRWQSMLRMLSELPPNQVRRMGGTMVVIGVIGLYFLL